MNTMLTETDAWAIATIFAAAMLAGWAAGWWRGRSASAGLAENPAIKFNDAILALLGLLLAFTFSMALGKHEQRRQMVVADSNAVGDFDTCVSLLDEPERGKLKSILREYVKRRLAIANPATDETALQQYLDEVQNMHTQMQLLIDDSVRKGTPVVEPLVETFNDVTSNHAARLASLRDRLPSSVVVLLFLAAMLSMAPQGWQQGQAHTLCPFSTVAFTILISMVVWVTLDLNQPQRGLITVSQEPLERLLMGMEK